MYRYVIDSTQNKCSEIDFHGAVFNYLESIPRWFSHVGSCGFSGLVINSTTNIHKQNIHSLKRRRGFYKCSNHMHDTAPADEHRQEHPPERQSI